MSARTTVDRAKMRAVEAAIATASGQRLVLNRGTYGRLAAHGISRREIHRALVELEAHKRVLVYCVADLVVARLIGGER